MSNFTWSNFAYTQSDHKKDEMQCQTMRMCNEKVTLFPKNGITLLKWTIFSRLLKRDIILY